MRQAPLWTHERSLFGLILLSGLAAVVVSLVAVWRAELSLPMRSSLAVVLLGLWLGLAWAARDRVVRPLRTLSNLLAALREGDFSIRARAWREGGALGEVTREVNALTDVLQEQRLGALEATALLRGVMEQINVAVFAFDDTQRLRLLNRAGERLLGQPAERATGRTAVELGLGSCLQGEPTRTLDISLPGGFGRWGLRRSEFRQRGVPHQLLVLTDLSQTLRAEERQAWQRLLRVLGHELNNSLAPVKSIAGSLEKLVALQPLPPYWKEDVQNGLGVISSRAEALSRFMEAYSRLARLPEPQPQPVAVEAWVRRIAGLETRLQVEVVPGSPATIQADPDQLDQLLINLVRNGADAARETKGGVRVGWRQVSNHFELWVEDDGPGLSNTTNLFVPFFTTKAGGSGIGLVLSRQIAEAHGGTLTLEERPDQAGCVARLRLPVIPHQSPGQ